MIDREYFFDEGLGESLDSHITNLKQELPGAEVSHRKDIDGYAVVKLSLKRKFKYNLDQLLSIDP